MDDKKFSPLLKLFMDENSDKYIIWGNFLIEETYLSTFKWKEYRKFNDFTISRWHTNI